MNIEVANRLYQYRKKMGISQEELAEKIGVSRQAVSKWERAEASPDTDNLIELAHVYGVTLDELLQGREESEEQEAAAQAQAEEVAQPEEEAPRSGIHIDEDGEHVHIGWDGIHVHDKHGTKVDVDRQGIFVTENGEQKVYTDADGRVHKSEDVIAQEHKDHNSAWQMIPYPIITVIAYLLFGYFNVCGGWGYGWIVFLTIPLYYTIIEAIRRRDAAKFAYPVFAAAAYLVMGFVWNLWHPGWVIFLTIPVYYGIVSAVRKSRKE